MNYDAIWTADAHPFVSEVEETEALRAARQGDEDATLRVLIAYLPVMRAVIRDYTPEARPIARYTAADLEDYRSAAVMGVLSAIRAWDPEVSPSIAGIVRQHVNEHVAAEAGFSASFSIPSRTLKRFFGIARRAGYDREEGARLAPQFEMSPATFLAIFDRVWLDSIDTVASGTDEDQPCREVREAPLSETTWSADAPVRGFWGGDESAFADVEDRILVQMAFNAVDNLEATVCGLAYGFLDYDPVPDAEIAHRLGLSSRLKALRIRTKALDKMRDAIGA